MPDEAFFDAAAAVAELRRRGVGFHAFAGRWEDRHWLNTPGPFYGAETDDCAMGPDEAPDNVAFVPHRYERDERGGEVVYRQPRSLAEVEWVRRAASVDPLFGYALDGNDHWTLSLIREWWARRDEIERAVQLLVGTAGAPRAWLDYLNDGMHEYLRRYAFFLEERRAPTAADRLPDV